MLDAQLLHRRNAGAEVRRRLVMRALSRPRTQSELRECLGMSNSGTLHLLRRMEHEGLVRAAERVGGTRIWECPANSGSEDKAK